MIRLYFCDVVNAPHPAHGGLCDMPRFISVLGGVAHSEWAHNPSRNFMVGWADVTDAQHTTLVADARIVVLDLDAKQYRDLSTATRTELNKWSLNVTATSTLREVTREIVRALTGIDGRRIGSLVI